MLVNDVQSKLNLTPVLAIASPGTLDDLRRVVAEAGAAGRRLSISGGRHSMGGQQFGTDTVLIDARGLDRVLDFDRERGWITVEGGIQWPALLDHLEAVRRRDAHPWGITQKQTGADRLTLAGALSCNAHGRGLTLPPIVGQIESLDLLTPTGEIVTCSRTTRPELFALAIGGYGLFGIIARIVLRLRRRCKMRRVVDVAGVAGLMDRMAERIRDGFEYGDFQFAIDADDRGFLDRGVLSCYEPVAADTPLSRDPVRFSEQDWLDLAVAAHCDKKNAFRRYVDTYLATSGQVYWSDAQLSGPYLDGYHEHVDRVLGRPVRGSEMITELYVPRGRFGAFMGDARQILRERMAEVIYGTVRLIERDEDSFLAWAREAWACVVLNLHVDHTREGVAAAAETFRSLIDAAIGHGGSYYLAYHRWARPDQVETCYPRMRPFLEAKRGYDPDELIQSEWYRWHRRLLGMR